jgi:hypothetical protein
VSQVRVRIVAQDPIVAVGLATILGAHPRLELYRNGDPESTYTATGRGEPARLRRELKDAHLSRASRSQSHPGKA